MKKTCSILLIFLMLFCLLGCDTYEMFGWYPENKSTVWYCDEIDLEFRYVPNEYGNLVIDTSPLEWDGMIYPVNVDIFAGYFGLYRDNGGAPTTEDDDLLTGEWQYENGNLIVTIVEDNIFDNAFEKLVFKPIAQNEQHP